MKICLSVMFWSRLVVILSLLFLPCAASYAQSPVTGQGLPSNRTKDAAILEEKIRTYNRDFCPPRMPITEISDLTLLKLVTVELLERDQMPSLRGLELVDGRVVSRSAGGENAGNLSSGNNLVGDLQASCEELKSKNTRGQSAGNKKPEKLTKLKARKVTYRDRDNQLHEIDVYSPPKTQSKKKKKVKGQKGKKVKDYATARLLLKNTDKDDSGKFDRMPSADSWVDED